MQEDGGRVLPHRVKLVQTRIAEGSTCILMYLILQVAQLG